jgi:hypothetical protein
MLIVNRFQCINPEKDGGIVRGISDKKNEVKIITSPDETFELWKEFLEKHSTGGLINPDILARFNQAKNFKVTKNFTLAREFFKHLGHFTDEDLKVFVQHLLIPEGDGAQDLQASSYPLLCRRMGGAQKEEAHRFARIR